MLWEQTFPWAQNLGNTDSDGLKHVPLCRIVRAQLLSYWGCGIQELSTVFTPNSPLPLQDIGHCFQPHAFWETRLSYQIERILRKDEQIKGKRVCREVGSQAREGGFWQGCGDPGLGGSRRLWR